MVEYLQITDPFLQGRVRDRYQRETASLEALGFRHLAYCLELLGPYSALLQFPIIPLALLKREILRFRRPLRLASANVLLSCPNPPTIALCMAMGVKFFSAFSNGSLIISSDFRSRTVLRPDSKAIRLPHRPTLEETWSAHEARALQIASESDPISRNISFDDYVKMCTMEGEARIR